MTAAFASRGRPGFTPPYGTQPYTIDSALQNWTRIAELEEALGGAVDADTQGRLERLRRNEVSQGLERSKELVSALAPDAERPNAVDPEKLGALSAELDRIQSLLKSLSGE